MTPQFSIRLGTESDAPAAARLHSAGITGGFLSTLGSRFLNRLYRRIARDQSSFLLVAEVDGVVIGMTACSHNTATLYRSFILHDALLAGLGAFGPILRSLPRVIETLRYPSSKEDAGLPKAEVLATAVEETMSGKGVGRSLVQGALTEFTTRGIAQVKTNISSNNEASLRLYRSNGFIDSASVEIHAGTHSVVLVWRAP